jgi:hypothetical protein
MNNQEEKCYWSNQKLLNITNYDLGTKLDISLVSSIGVNGWVNYNSTKVVFQINDPRLGSAHKVKVDLDYGDLKSLLDTINYFITKPTIDKTGAHFVISNKSSKVLKCISMKFYTTSKGFMTNIQLVDKSGLVDNASIDMECKSDFMKVYQLLKSVSTSYPALCNFGTSNCNNERLFDKLDKLCSLNETVIENLSNINNKLDKNNNEELITMLDNRFKEVIDKIPTIDDIKEQIKANTLPNMANSPNINYNLLSEGLLGCPVIDGTESIIEELNMLNGINKQSEETPKVDNNDTTNGSDYFHVDSDKVSGSEFEDDDFIEFNENFIPNENNIVKMTFDDDYFEKFSVDDDDDTIYVESDNINYDINYDIVIDKNTGEVLNNTPKEIKENYVEPTNKSPSINNIIFLGRKSFMETISWYAHWVSVENNTIPSSFSPSNLFLRVYGFDDKTVEKFISECSDRYYDLEFYSLRTMKEFIRVMCVEQRYDNTIPSIEYGFKIDENHYLYHLACECTLYNSILMFMHINYFSKLNMDKNPEIMEWMKAVAQGKYMFKPFSRLLDLSDKSQVDKLKKYLINLFTTWNDNGYFDSIYKEYARLTSGNSKIEINQNIVPHIIDYYISYMNKNNDNVNSTNVDNMLKKYYNMECKGLKSAQEIKDKMCNEVFPKEIVLTREHQDDELKLFISCLESLNIDQTYIDDVLDNCHCFEDDMKSFISKRFTKLPERMKHFYKFFIMNRSIDNKRLLMNKYRDYLDSMAPTEYKEVNTSKIDVDLSKVFGIIG